MEKVVELSDGEISVRREPMRERLQIFYRRVLDVARGFGQHQVLWGEAGSVAAQEGFFAKRTQILVKVFAENYFAKDCIPISYVCACENLGRIVAPKTNPNEPKFDMLLL